MQERIKNITDEFTQYNDWEDRYKLLIKLGRSLTPMDEADHTEKYKIKGCQSQVWLKPSYQQGKVSFIADSDAVLVKGIIGVLVKAYSDSTPDEILNYQGDFLKQIGITEHLSMNRTNGLASMLKQIQMYAVAYKTLADKGIMDLP